MSELQRLQNNLQEILVDMEKTKKQLHGNAICAVHDYEVSRIFAQRDSILKQQLEDLNFRKLDIERQISELGVE